MRVAALLLLLTALAVGGVNRLPREGSGWAGFGVGTSVRMKRTATLTGRTPMVTLWTTKLTKADDTSLTIETLSSNALGMENQTTQVLSRRGDAGQGEKQTVDSQGEQAVQVAGRRYTCRKTRTTVKGPTGTRVITKWIVPTEQFWAKRTEIRTDPEGTTTFQSTWLATAIDQPLTVGGRKLTCVAYKVLARYGDKKQTGTVHVCRDIPGSTVLEKGEVFNGSTRELVFQVEALSFDVR